MRFPDASGDNLSGQRFHLPGDFAGECNLVFVAFTQEQQYDVYTWLPLVQELTSMYPTLRDYEVPVVGEMPFYRRMLLDYWMRTGIPDATTRDKTITLYTDIPAFLQALTLPDARTIYALLVQPDGQVVWHERGAYTPEKALALQTVLADHLHIQSNSETQSL